MKTTCKKLMTLVLTFVMVLGMLPSMGMPVEAASTDTLNITINVSDTAKIGDPIVRDEIAKGDITQSQYSNNGNDFIKTNLPGSNNCLYVSNYQCYGSGECPFNNPYKDAEGNKWHKADGDGKYTEGKHYGKLVKIFADSLQSEPTYFNVNGVVYSVLKGNGYLYCILDLGTLDENGNFTGDYFKSKHTHDWKYSATANKLTAKCEGAEDCDVANGKTDGVSLTLTASDETYSGTAYTGASLGDTTAWVSAVGGTAPTIKYVGRGSTTYTESDTAPTAVGTYTAKVTVGTATATKDFTISKATTTLTVTDLFNAITGKKCVDIVDAGGILCASGYDNVVEVFQNNSSTFENVKKVSDTVWTFDWIYETHTVNIYGEEHNMNGTECNDCGYTVIPTVVNDWDALKTALADGGYVKLGSDITAPSGTSALNVTKAATLDLNGKVLDAAGKFTAFWVKTGADLTITDSNKTENHDGYLDENGLWHLGSAPGSETAYPIVGGIITGGKGRMGGAIYMDGGKLTMNAGTIAGNISNNATTGAGGGIYAASGATSVALTGTAKIIGNTASDNGGGVYSLCATTIDGGVQISNNHAGKNGGGVYVAPDKLTISGSVQISGNTAVGNGGGVFANQGTVINGTNVRITENTAALGGGVCVNVASGTITVGGVLVVNDNKNTSDETENVTFRLASSAFDIATEGGLAAGSNIGVTLASDHTGGTTFVTSGATDTNMAYFNSDDGLSEVKRSEGTLYLQGPGNFTQLKEDLDFTGTLVKLERSYVRAEGESGILLSNGQKINLDLNGHTIDGANSTVEYGYIFRLNAGTELTIGDSSTDKTGTIKGGTGLTTNDGDTIYQSGGVIYNNQGKVTINGGTFTGNKVANSGGVAFSSGTLTINGGTFTGNEAGFGGVVNSTAADTVEINDGTFTGNKATTSGGVIYAVKELTIENGTFTGNKATTSGGAIYTSNVLTIEKGTFTGNEAKYGGAVYGSKDGTVTIGDGTFTDNKATENGGALSANKTLTITKGTFSGNEAKFGGAVFNDTNGTLTIKDGTFTGNKATTSGGVIYNSGTVEITTGTFTSNEAASGGVARNNGSLTIIGGSFTGNTATSNAGAIYNNSGKTLTLGGTVQIKNNTKASNANNVYLDNSTVTLSTTTALATGAEIGITTTGDTVASSGAVIGTLAFFKSDDSTKLLCVDKGALKIETTTTHKHSGTATCQTQANCATCNQLYYGAHNYGYSAAGNVLTASCQTSGCTESVSLTLTASDASYSGSAYTGASLGVTTAWTGASLTEPTIEYVGRGTTEYTKSTTAPTTVGTYTAQITVDGKTASANFEIKPARIGESDTYWDVKDGVLTISGTGDIPNFITDRVLPWYNIRNNITSVVIEDKVTSIGTSTFQSCSKITNVTIPNSVTSIGAKAFQKCSSLTNITIPDSVTSIGANAFASCSGLTSVTFEGTVGTDGSGIATIAFSGVGTSGADKTTLYLPCPGLTRPENNSTAWNGGYFKTVYPDWIYSANGATLTAACDKSHDASCTVSVSLTLTASDANYSGSAYTGASLGDTTAWVAAVGGTAPTIKYVGKAPTSYNESETAPTAVGTYTAKVTVDGKTATKDFTIAQAGMNDLLVEANDGNGTVLKYGGEQKVPVKLYFKNADGTRGAEVDVSNFTVTGNTASDPGTYTITIAAKEGGNLTGSVAVQYSIVKEEDEKNVVTDGSSSVHTVTTENAPATKIAEKAAKTFIAAAMDEATKAIVEDGGKMEIVLTTSTVDETDETVQQEIKAIKEAAKATGVTFMDLKLTKIVTDKDKNITTTGISDAAALIEITVEIPEEISKAPAGYTRSYKVLRSHNGVVEVLSSRKVDNALVFSSDKFSTYAIAYTDTKIPAPTTTNRTSPKTGDNTTNLNMMVMLMSAAVLAGVELLRKKSK